MRSGSDLEYLDEYAAGLRESLIEYLEVLIRDTSADAVSKVAEIVENNSEELEHNYLKYMSSNIQLNAVSGNEGFMSQLVQSYLRWAGGFAIESREQIDNYLENESEIGRLMARINYPPYLVSNAVRTFKYWVLEKLSESASSRSDFEETFFYVSKLIDAGVSYREINYYCESAGYYRTEEAFRSTWLTQDLGVEKEKQKACLMEWANEILSSVHFPDNDVQLSSLDGSEFGLWVKHKAPLIFTNDPRLKSISEVVEIVDRSILSEVENSLRNGAPVSPNKIRSLQTRIASIRDSLSAMFEHYSLIEGARDDLTKLLGRRFLPTVLKREIKLQFEGQDKGLVLLLLDIDYFKKVNDSYGHQAGDIVLRQIARIIQDSLRGSDFAFRYGGEEIMIVLTGTKEDIGIRVAQNISSRIKALEIALNDKEKVNVTVSIGVAAFNGEPDFELLIKRADDALYRAKELGRDRIEVGS